MVRICQAGVYPQQKFNDRQIVELAKLCAKIETHYKFPCDIEWALERGKFYIVQSRPITTLWWRAGGCDAGSGAENL